MDNFHNFHYVFSFLHEGYRLGRVWFRDKSSKMHNFHYFYYVFSFLYEMCCLRRSWFI